MEKLWTICVIHLELQSHNITFINENFQTHSYIKPTVAELQSDELLITCAQDGLDIMGELYYEGFDKIIMTFFKYYGGVF
jgi:hypothetical protein